MTSVTSLSLNVGNFITLKLSPTNYPLWREQALALAESQDLVNHLTNEDPAPTQYTTLDTNTTTNTENFVRQLTNEFIAWRKSNRLLRGWIIGTLSEEALGLVVGLDTAQLFGPLTRMHTQKIRKNVNSHFANRSRIFVKKKIEISQNTFASSKVYVTTLLQLGNMSRTKKKCFISYKP